VCIHSGREGIILLFCVYDYIFFWAIKDTRTDYWGDVSYVRPQPDDDVRITKSRTTGVGSKGKGRPTSIMPTDIVLLYS
jgi:hypothetical protein